MVPFKSVSLFLLLAVSVLPYPAWPLRTVQVREIFGQLGQLVGEEDPGALLPSRHPVDIVPSNAAQAVPTP